MGLEQIEFADTPPIAVETPLIPRVTIFPSADREVDAITGKVDGWGRHLLSHHLGLVPPEAAVEEDPDIFDLRAEKVGYVYRTTRSGLVSREDGLMPAIVRPDIFGVRKRGEYGFPTRSALRWGEGSSSFLFHQGAWTLVRFRVPTENPPATLFLHQPQGSRRLMPPGPLA